MRYIRSVIATLLLMAFFASSMITKAAPPTIGGCQIFPADNPWNADISGATKDPKSDAYITAIGGGTRVHPDFGNYFGIPYTTVDSTQPKVPITFDYDDSDVGLYPFPTNPPIEGGGDRHVIVLETDNCMLYETWDSHYVGGPQHAWHTGSGAIFNLNTNALRPDGWTSADAAGLPILAGLARCDEANSDSINHAIRFTSYSIRTAHIYPATHEVNNDNNPNHPPMGQRFRLKASFSEVGYTGQALAVIHAMKKYGLILADIGGNWFISGAADTCWDNEDLDQLKAIPGNQFEAIISPAPAAVVLPSPSIYSPADTAAISDNTPILDWNVVTSADEYEMRYGQDNPPVSGTIHTIQATDITQYAITTPLLTGFTYYWQVRAIDNDTATTTAWSSPASFSIASPAGIGPTRGYYTDTTPTLTWNKVIWAIKYKIQVSDTANFSHLLVDKLINAPTLEYTLTAPEALGDGVYYWHVAAQDANGNLSGYSPTETFIVNG